MNDLEPKLGPGYIQLCDYKPITFISAYQYMLDAIKEFDKLQELNKAQEITDEEIENYYN